MRVGYVQINQKKKNSSEEADKLKKALCDYIYIENYEEKHHDLNQKTKLRLLLKESRPGDVLVLSDFDQIGGYSQKWLELLNELKVYGLELEILVSPGNQLKDWFSVFNWLKTEEEERQPKIKVRKFSREQAIEKSQYQFFSRDSYFRRRYHEIFHLVMGKHSLREITKKTGAPLGTVVRIRKEYEKLKQTVLLVGTFFLTIVSLKMVQHYSTNSFLQILICGIMTILVIYFTYSDSQSE